MSAVLKRELAKVKKMIHPNSRKSIAIAKKTKKICNRMKAKRAGTMKRMVLLDKLEWIQDNMVPDVCPYTPELTAELLEKYIARHDEELSGIAKNHKYDMVRMSQEREREEYENSGIEIPNILVAAQCKKLREWNGDERYLPNFVYRRFGKKHLQEALQRNAKVQKKAANPSEEMPVLPESAVTAEMDTE